MHCSICLGPAPLGTLTPCGDCFHTACMAQWMAMSTSHPLYDHDLQWRSLPLYNPPLPTDVPLGSVALRQHAPPPEPALPRRRTF